MIRQYLKQSAKLALIFGLALAGCAGKTPVAQKDTFDPSCRPDKLFACALPANKLTVTAMAYTDRCSGKKKTLPKAANGQVLTPDCRVVAVSPDLLNLGLSFDKKVRIEGLDGEFTVMDLMNPRHSRSIDIYFGPDHAGARAWGLRTLNIYWD